MIAEPRPPHRPMPIAIVLALLIGLVALADTANAQTATAPPAVDDVLRCDETDSQLIVMCGDSEVLRYNIVALKAPQGIDSAYERSGYIHPIYTPDGHMVSGDFAADHPHQHGLFAAWTDASYRGRTIDFWNQHRGSGIVLHDRVVSVGPPGESVQFSVAVKHLAILEDGKRTEILDDIWTVKVGKSIQNAQLIGYSIDYTIDQTNVTKHPLTINEYHYGGIGFRGNNTWYSDPSAKALAATNKKPDSELPPLNLTRHRFETSEGHDRRKGNHSRPEWTMIYGLVDGDKIAGVKVSGSETNFRSPHPVRLHPTKPYFSISPCVVGAFDILPETTYEASYRFEVFDGRPH